MPFFKRPNNDIDIHDPKAISDALDKVQAVIWFDPEGNILDANENLCSTMGYDLEEIKGRHHRMFVDPSYGASEAYAEFWRKLGQGEPCHGEYQRFSKNGEKVWLEASYNPILGDDGKPQKVVKFAVDITTEMTKNLDYEGKVKALQRALAVIEFEPDGTIISANENFLATVGYSPAEVAGKHHRIFMPRDMIDCDDYERFWTELGAGQFQSGIFPRIGKGGTELYLRATYNPIFDANGKVVKVVKFATDITDQTMKNADMESQLAAISKSQAVIEFDLDGNILTANENFQNALGYNLGEIKGKHHQMFVDPVEANTDAYRDFWKSLKNGEFKSGEYKRVAKGGREIWINATYNPIFDPKGKPYKVVKFASDITEKKQAMNMFFGALTEMSEGDLTARIPDDVSEEFRTLAETFNKAMQQFEDLVQGILETSAGIADDSKAISDSAADLATRSERQAASVEQTSAAMEEISATVKSTAENAETATAAVEAASEHAKKGSVVVNDAVVAMKRIEESASKIRTVVEVIDGIAFQTNLLALNAGVEAARAGDAGRGFAVVASEVRALAQRAADSAQEINKLIADSNEEVVQGSKLVDSSGTALADIAAGVVTVVENINDILVASREQAQGVTEVTQAVADIDNTTQNTAALAEESSAAATLLAERASSLRELVSFFSISAQASAARAGHSNTAPAPVSAGEATWKADGFNDEVTHEPAKKVAVGGGSVASLDQGDGWDEF